MIKFFRKIKQDLLSEGKTGKYLKYAIGEIILVVIGILIAIQINSWKQVILENKLEKKYLTNLILELEEDSIGLSINYNKLKNQARTKSLLLNMIKEDTKGDSIIEYFEYQWRPIQPYIPIKATYIEMSSNSHLRIIKNDILKEKMIKLYNSYEGLGKEDELLNQTSTQNILNMISRNIPDLSDYGEQDIMSLKSHTHILNTIQLNGAYTRRDNYKKMIMKCSELIQDIRNYQKSQK